jgi:hypothetical protein
VEVEPLVAFAGRGVFVELTFNEYCSRTSMTDCDSVIKPDCDE